MREDGRASLAQQKNESVQDDTVIRREPAPADRAAVPTKVPFSSAEEARRAAHIYAEVLGGAVACRHDPGADTVGQGVIIGKYGVMAEEKSAHLPVRSNPDNVIRLKDHRAAQRT